jgi:hypothetical protein
MFANREATMNQESLRLLIQRKIRDGRLPHDSITKIWSSPRAGETCDACERLLAETHLVMTAPSMADKTFAKLHADCYVLWNAELNGAMNAHQP